MRRALFALLAACGGDAVSLEPIYEIPTDEDALPTGLDNLVLSVAHAGSDEDLASRSFAPGDGAELAKVPFDDALVIHLTGSLRGSQVAYGRTCTFAVSNDEVPRPHLWFARNVKFASLSLTPGPHTGGSALAHDGGALLIGGTDDTSIEFFDPRLGSLSPLGSVMARNGATIATRIGLGGAERIAILGGNVAVLELVESTTGQARVDAISAPNFPRYGATATSLTDGRVIVIGGTRVAAPIPVDSLIEITTSGTGTEIQELGAKLARPRLDHTATRLGDDVGAPVLIVGGREPGDIPVAVAELFKPLSRDLASPMTFAPAMKSPRYGHRAELMPDGSVLVIGGIDASRQPVLDIERFTIDAGFTTVAKLPVGAGVIDMTTTRLPDGRILITGGRATVDGDPVNLAMIARLDVVNGQVDVVGTDVMATPRANHFAVPLCDGTIWISGGAQTAPLAERYNPPPTGRR